MGVSRDNLEKVRNALDPLEIIREAVPSLKQSGPRWKGLCPFHNERTPSFFFMPEKGLWHCFGACQEGGDVFKFVMRMENLTFPEALRQLAQRAGVRIEWEGQDERASRAQQERERLLDLLNEAVASYRGALRNAADAEPARRHLAKRKIRPETVERFQLGYAPRTGGFLDGALRKGVKIEDLLKAGLAVRSDRTGRYHDPMQGRLTFPIFDAYGQAVGFGGRVLEDAASDAAAAGPKYLNSPETPVYTKGRHLYGLHQGRAALRERKQVVVVEGYMDVVGCHQAGTDHAVAPLGTAFTAEQARLLKRYAEEAILLFDPDEAGRRASWRSAEVLLQADIFVKVATVPGGKDPDELVLEKGPAALETVIREAQDLVDFWLDEIASGPEGLHGRVRKAEELIQFLRGVPNEILRQEWLRKAARRLSLDERTLAREFEKRAPTAKGAPSPAPAASSAKKASPRVRSAEEELIQLLCAHPEVWPSELPETLFNDLRCRAVAKKLEERRAAGGGLDVAGLAADLNPEDASWLTGLLVEDKAFDNPADALAARLRSLEQLAADRERRALEKDVTRMLAGQAPRDEAKISRYQTLTRTIKGHPGPA